MTLSRSAVLVLGAALSVFSACAAEDEFGDGAPIDDQPMEAASESGDAITTRYPAGTAARTTAALNLRTSPSTSARIILTMPNSSSITLVDGVPQSGWYVVRFNGTQGYAFGQYISASAVAPPPGGGGGGGGGATMSPGYAGQLTRAQAGVGFAYWWGHSSWLPSGPTASTQSTCNGSCPSCTHSGRYGADCSGFVGKVWQISECGTDLAADRHGPGTGTYRNSTGGGQWANVNRNTVRGGDAMVYNTGSHGHIMWVNSGDGWGALDVFEAPGCSGAGRIRHGTRGPLGSEYIAIRRN